MCCKYTLSLPFLYLPSLLLSFSAFSLQLPLSCIPFSLLLHYSNLYSLKKKPACFYYMRCNAESKLSISGGKKLNRTFAMTFRRKLTLSAYICMRNVFLLFFLFFSFNLFGFRGLREILSIASQCVTVSFNKFTVSICLSVQESIHLI